MSAGKRDMSAGKREVGSLGGHPLYGSEVNGKRYPAPREAELGQAMTGVAEGEYISLGDLLRVIWRRRWVVLLVTLVVTGAVVGVSFAQTPVYQASIKILIGQESGITQVPSEAVGLQTVTQTMVGGVSSRPVAKAVIRQENLRLTTDKFLEEHLIAEQETDTQWIHVTYRDVNPVRAQRVANAVGDVFTKRVSEVNQSGNAAITATVWERAVVPDTPVRPDTRRNGILAFLFGLVLGVVLAFVLEYLDDRWNSPEEMKQVSGIPTFGIIPGSKNSKIRSWVSAVQSPLKTGLRRVEREAETDELAGRLVTVLDPTSAAAEAYRTLRTNLLFALVDNPPIVDNRPKIIVLTSPGTREGKSTVCTNLGVVLALVGKDVLIVDCDFRKPVIHKFFGIRNLHGVVDVLEGERRLQESWKEPVEGLKVVPAGPVPPNPTELLSTRRFSELLASAKEEFDYVLVDAPPVGMISDAAILAIQADGVLLVSDAQNTRKKPVLQAISSLENVGANILGTVMNNVEASGRGYDFNDTYYYSMVR
jgi:capsular exopolysaccharide synthesis family protein